MSIDCGICLGVTSAQNRYICSETGRGRNKGKPHIPLHLTCTQDWVRTERGKGSLNAKIVCPHPGCNTDISHLVPKPQPGYFDRAVDFLEKYPSVTILTSGLIPLGVGHVYGAGSRTLVSMALVSGPAISALIDKRSGRRVRVLTGLFVGVSAALVGNLWQASTGNFADTLTGSAFTVATMGVATLAAFASNVAEIKAATYVTTYVATSLILGLSLKV